MKKRGAMYLLVERKKKSSYYFPESIKVKGTLVRKTKKILGFSETLKEVTSLDTIR